MKELSLNILDIARNSLRAGARHVGIELTETPDSLTIRISDDGCGMDSEKLSHVTDPFFTSRTTRKVGLGLPFFRLAAEQTGGSMTITSVPESESSEHGTVVTAVFDKTSIDYTPLGDIISTVCTLIQGMGDTDLTFTHRSQSFSVSLDTAEMRAVLGDVPLSVPEVLVWIRGSLEEQYAG